MIPGDEYCDDCRGVLKEQELREIIEYADFLEELDCPREVLIDAACRWNIEQDCEALNLPDEK